MRNIVMISALFWGLAAAAPGQADEPAKQSGPAKADAAGQQKAQAPWQRMLTGESAKRVVDLEAKLKELREAGSVSEAASVAREILEVRTRQQGADHWQTVDARWHLKTLEKVKSLPAANQKEWAAAFTWEKEASTLDRQGRYGAAQPLYQKALDVRLRLLGEDHPDTARSYNNLASNLNNQNRYSEALPLLRKTLNLQLKLLGENHPGTATSYGNLAFDLQGQGRYAAAEPLFQKALNLKLKLLGESNPSTATDYSNLAANLQAQGRYDAALPLFQKALHLHLKLLGENQFDTAMSYNNLAINLQFQGRYSEALPLQQKALDLQLKLLGENHPYTAVMYNNLATNLQFQGRYSEAEPLLQKALDLYRRVLGENHPGIVVSYNNLAYNFAAQGRYDAAQLLFQKALDLQVKLLGENHSDTASYYNNLARSLQAQGRYAEAQPLLRKALDLQVKLQGENHPATAVSYNNLAMGLQEQGRYEEAQPLLRKAFDLHSKLLGANHPRTIASYYNVAANLHAQGQYEPAERLLRTAARSYAEARHRGSLSGSERANLTQLPSPLPLLAAVLARNGKPEPAWIYLEEDLGRGLLDDLAARQLATQKLTSRERQRQQELVTTLQRQEKLFQQLPPRNKGDTQAQKRWAELKRRYQEAQTALSQFQADMAQKYGVALGQAYDLAHIQAQLPADAALLTWVDVQGQPKAVDPNGEHWACLVRAKGTPIWVRLPGSGAQGTWTKEDDDLPHRLRQALAQHQDDSSELARKLYAQRLAPLEKHLDAAGPLPAVKHLIVLPVRWMAGVPIEALTDRFTISYAPSGTLFARLREQHPAAATARAPARLLAVGDPAFAPLVVQAKPAPTPPDHGVLLNVVQRGSNADHAGLKSGDVLLSYAGTKLANPAALRQAIGQHRPKPDSPTRGVQTVALTVWREGQTLELSAAPGPLGVVPSKDAAAVGIQARREGDALLRGLRGATLPTLPGSRTEVQAIAGLFPDAEMLVGSDASEQRLDQLVAQGRLRQFRYLHFATHGMMNDRIPLQSSLALAQDHLPDPLAQVLAGKKAYDGRLTAEQILQSWKLDADLVTLSACQTGLGRQGGGDGYIGFAQVLFLAGARSLVLSLWEVDDRATALLMVRFYQNLLGKRAGLTKPLPKAEALAEAKRWLRGLSREEVERLVKALPGSTRLGKSKDPSPVVNAAARPFAHPYYWSAFILIGDPD